MNVAPDEGAIFPSSSSISIIISVSLLIIAVFILFSPFEFWKTVAPVAPFTALSEFQGAQKYGCRQKIFGQAQFLRNDSQINRLAGASGQSYGAALVLVR